MLNHKQLVQELAAQFYINKDRVTVGWGVVEPGTDKSTLKDFPDPNRQWHNYRDEWQALTKTQRQVWIDKAEAWLSEWKQKNEHLYPFLLENGKSVFGAMV